MTRVTKSLCLYKYSGPAPGLYTCIKTWKNMYKIRLQRCCFETCNKFGKVTRLFCWHQDFVHKGLSAPAPGLYTCGKTFKNVYKIRIQRDLFGTCNKWSKWRGLSVDIKSLFFSWKGVSVLAPGTCIKGLKYIPGPGVMWAFTGFCDYFNMFEYRPLRNCFGVWLCHRLASSNSNSIKIFWTHISQSKLFKLETVNFIIELFLHERMKHN